MLARLAVNRPKSLIQAMKTMADYELLGKFYLGKAFDLKAGKPRGDLVLYDSKDLTTHAVCVGMTGSGKTGLCLALLGRGGDRRHPGDRDRSQGGPRQPAADVSRVAARGFSAVDRPRGGDATRRFAGGAMPRRRPSSGGRGWRSGASRPSGSRSFAASVDMAIYTPGSSAGLPLTVLRSFAPPPKAVLDDTEALRDRLQAAVASLLGLAGVQSDAMTGREHILLSNILEKSLAGRRKPGHRRAFARDSVAEVRQDRRTWTWRRSFRPRSDSSWRCS